MTHTYILDMDVTYLDIDVWHVFIAPPSDKVMIKICVFMSFFLHEHARIFVIFAEKLIVKDSWYFVILTLSSNSDRTKNHENHIFILKLTTLAIIRNIATERSSKTF